MTSKVGVKHKQRNIKLYNRQLDLTAYITDEDRAKKPALLRILEDEIARCCIALDGLKLLIEEPELLNEESASAGIVELIQVLATRDPNRVHHANVREAVKILKEDILSSRKNKQTSNQLQLTALDNSETQDRLARELVNFCNAFVIKLSEESKSSKEKNPLNKIEETYLNLLGNYGHQGTVAKNGLVELFRSYSDQGNNGLNSRLTFWINTENSLSNALQIYVQVFFKEYMQQELLFPQTYPSAAAASVMKDFTTIVSPGGSCRKTSNNLQLYNGKNQHVGIIQTPTISKDILELFCRYAKHLNSIYAVRILEWVLTSALNCYINGNKSYDIHIPGRGTQLADILGFNSNIAITTINELMILLNNTTFSLPGIKSRLISIAECLPNSPYSSKGGWIVTILPPCRPFKAKKERELLIPLLKDFRLIGKTNKAEQVILKWLIAIEFSNQSTRLAQEGSIIITNKRWAELFHEAELPFKSFTQIHEAITEHEGYLEQKAPDRYRLREEAPQRLLEDQGKRRIEKSIKGKTKGQNSKTNRCRERRNKKTCC